MAQQVHAIFIHGVGTQKAGYSDFAQKQLSAGLPRGTFLNAQEVLWAPVLDKLETTMLKSVKKNGSRNKLLQRVVVETLADALCYSNSSGPIFDLIDAAYARTRADTVHIFGHSLGALLAVEWLRTRERTDPRKLVTFGCNLQLFHLGDDAWRAPPQVSVPNKWVNCFDDADMLGWPLRGWLPHVKDVEVNVGSWWQRWNGLAHTGYFTDKTFWRSTIPTLL
jgi:pimeloyl-ACP methyl ester carboxylesterase